MTNILQGWTPKTNVLLLDKSNTSIEDRNHHGGYDIIDHAFGKVFPSQLLDELQTNGWIDNATSAQGGKLQPARTKMDVDIDDLLSSFVNPFITNDGGDSSRTLSNGAAAGTRGDESAFISRRERVQGSFPTKKPLLHRLIGSIERTACSKLGKCGSDRSKHVSPEGATNGAANEDDLSSNNGAYFDFDTSMTSVQIAKYPGDGLSGYPRHCDRGAKCVSEPSRMDDATDNDGAPRRLLTFVYYLTPVGWDEKLDGGALRMFSPDHFTNNDGNDGNGDVQHFDVIPYPDRLVVFRSDVIEHQVLPSLRRDRIAVTVWLYGRVVRPKLNDGTASESTLQLNGEGKPKPNNTRREYDDSSIPPSLPTSAPNGEEYRDKTIFVAIPSYRDEETWPTIKSLVEMATSPERVYIGVVFQVDMKSQDEVKRFTTADGCGISIESNEWREETHLRSIVMDYRYATGEYAGWTGRGWTQYSNVPLSAKASVYD